MIEVGDFFFLFNFLKTILKPITVTTPLCSICSSRMTHIKLLAYPKIVSHLVACGF